jgi:hypothetical protein
MIYICSTKNTQEFIDAMNGYSGTTLIHTHTNPSFLVWLWINPNQTDLSSAQLLSMASVHLT